jgi:hypothetical protein
LDCLLSVECKFRDFFPVLDAQKHQETKDDVAVELFIIYHEDLSVRRLEVDLGLGLVGVGIHFRWHANLVSDRDGVESFGAANNTRGVKCPLQDTFVSVSHAELVVALT